MCEETGSETVDQGRVREMGCPLKRDKLFSETPRVGRRAGAEEGQIRPHSRLSKPDAGGRAGAWLSMEWAERRPGLLPAGLLPGASLHGRHHQLGLLPCVIMTDKPGGGCGPAAPTYPNPARTALQTCFFLLLFLFLLFDGFFGEASD